MKKVLGIAAIIAALSSFNAMAVESVNITDSMKLQSIGQTPGVSALTPDDAEALIQKEAKEAGASYYRITSMGNSGDSSVWHATAELYR